MKFSEEPLKDQNFFDIPLPLKWTPVTIESPDVITEEDRLDMLFRLDTVFQPYGGGNDREFNDRIRELSGFKDNPWAYYGGGCFRVELFSSSYVYGPHSFFNFRNGKVSGCFSIGKFPQIVGGSLPEFEFIAKRYRKYRFFVTFFDDRKSICTLMIFDGKIQRVKTRTLKEVRYTEMTDYTYGSTGCNHRSFVERYVTNRDNLLSRVLSWVVLRLPDFGNSYDYYLECSEEKYFSDKEAFELCKKWRVLHCI